MSQTDDLFLVDDFLASWDNIDNNNEPIASCWQVSNTTLTMENGASLLLEDLLQCDEQLLNIPSPMDTTTTTFTLPSSSSSAVACLVEQQTTASQQQTQQDAAVPTTTATEDHVQQQQEVENCFRIVRSKKEQHDMTVLYACTELDSPKTNTSKTKKNPSHCIVAKNEKLTAQFYNNFQVVEQQQQQGEAILSLKLGFQQKLFLTCETHLVQIKIVSCDGKFVAFSKVIPMQMGAALFVFQVQDREQVRNMPFDIKFFDASQGQVLGKIASVLLQPQYKYNAMKRKLAAVASNGEQQQQPPSKKQRLV